ncbi:MAG: Methanol dehydrogenase [cytochrome c] subunit 1 [Gammaproteobacteria bacterium]|nr:Methanol dehydrogenase [cytochrome c] subunit 1 [Gammaproteobacteria bacterium]
MFGSERDLDRSRVPRSPATLCRAGVILALSVTARIALAGGGEAAPCSPTTDGWEAQAGDAANWRHSALCQIDRNNVASLTLAWQFSTGVQRGHEGGPLVVGDTLYLHTPYPNQVVAIGLSDRRVKWRYEPRQDESALAVLCCDTVNRGLAYGNGKVFMQQADTTLVALDAGSGQEIWKVKNGDPALGASATNAPHVFDRYVITGIAGGEYGVLGYLTAYDLDSGRPVWRGYSAGPDSGMLIDPDATTTWTDGAVARVGRNSSLNTWRGDQWKIGGGATWGWYSYDPELRLLYYGTGNPSTWNPSQRPGDNKWSASLWARDIDTGKVRWVYQMTPHDEWDYDGVNELTLFDGKDAAGRSRHMLAHFDRNGYAYTIDRETGELLIAERFDPSVNWAREIDRRSGRPQVIARYSPARTGEDGTTEGICPATIGAKNQAPAAYAPEPGLFLVPTNHLCMDYETFHVDYEQGHPYTGAAITMHPVEGSDGALGNFLAWDAIAGRIVWSRPEPYPLWGGALTTASGLVFYGTLDGHLKARDIRSGEQLWKSPPLPSGVVGNVTTWAYEGRQYIGVFAGIGGLANDPDGIGHLADAKALEPRDRSGGALVVFALPPSP